MADLKCVISVGGSNFDTWSWSTAPFYFLPEYGDAQVLSVPQDERDPLVVVGEADVARQVDAGARQATDLRSVAAWKTKEERGKPS